MAKTLPAKIDDFSNGIDDMLYGDVYAFATVFFGVENAYKTESGLRLLNRIKNIRSKEYDFECSGISREINTFYKLLEKFGYDGNPHMLVELENSSDNIVLNKVLEYIKNLNRFNDEITFKSKFFLEKGKYVPSYEYFLKHFTKKMIISLMIWFYFFKIR